MKRFKIKRSIVMICVPLIITAVLLPSCGLAEQNIWDTHRLLRSFSLVNVDTGKVIPEYSPLRNGTVINLADLPAGRIRIRANPRRKHRRKVKKVRFRVNGKPTKRLRTKRPFLLTGLPAQQVRLWQISGTTYLLRATPLYLNSSSELQRGKSTLLTFTIIDTVKDVPDQGTPDNGSDDDIPASPTASPISTISPPSSPLPTATGTPSPTSTYEPSPSPTPKPSPGAWWEPSPGTSWQWQLTGSIDTSFNVEMYDIDLFDVSQSVIDKLHSDGRIVVCYFSAGTYENWRPDAGDFSASVKGDSNGWAGENWLDIRDLDTLGPIMKARLDLAVAKDCDGVEPDNIDGYTNSTGFPLTYIDQLNYNKFLAEEAHKRNLSIGLKNDLDQVKDLEPFFDWALNEECFQYNECNFLLPFIAAGKAVFGVEYEGSTSSFCPQANAMDMDWLKKNLDLDAYRESCR